MVVLQGNGVMVYDAGRPGEVSRKYLGIKGRKARFKMGQWCFNNLVSAVIFEHIVSVGDLPYAEAVILRLEAVLQNSVLDSIDAEIGVFDVAEKIPHPAVAAVGKIGNIIKKISSTLGELITTETLNSYGGYTPHTASETNKYVNFALRYWGEHPGEGPAYRYVKTNPALKRKSPEFNPFGWK